MIFFFNFIILHRIICPWALSFFHFFFYISLFWEQVGQANPSKLAFSFTMFFYLTWAFFARPFFWRSFFFISISCYVWRVSRVNSSWLRFFPLIFYDFFSISSFCIKLFVLELHHFFHFFYCLVIPRVGW
jgi:hypothetical protein